MTSSSAELSGANLNYSTKAEVVYAEMRVRILNGEWPPSAALNQDTVAEELGVSVTPVREAMRRLEADGLVLFRAHKTIVVMPLSRDELRDIYDVRLQLDPYAGARAATRVTDADLRTIVELAEAPSAEDPIQQIRLNRAFHRAIYAHCGNDLLVETLDRFWERTDRYRILLAARDQDVLGAAREHVEIAEAMQLRTPGLVKRLIREHIANARSLIEGKLA